MATQIRLRSLVGGGTHSATGNVGPSSCHGSSTLPLIVHFGFLLALSARRWPFALWTSSPVGFPLGSGLVRTGSGLRRLAVLPECCRLHSVPPQQGPFKPRRPHTPPHLCGDWRGHVGNRRGIPEKGGPGGFTFCNRLWAHTSLWTVRLEGLNASAPGHRLRGVPRASRFSLKLSHFAA